MGKEFAPCEDELEAIKQGIEYDPVVSAREKYEASKRQKQEEEEEKKRAKGEKKFVPRTNYKHLIGSESALDAARVMETNKSFGMVSSESKKDKRSVEVIQAEIRAHYWVVKRSDLFRICLHQAFFLDKFISV